MYLNPSSYYDVSYSPPANVTLTDYENGTLGISYESTVSGGYNVTIKCNGDGESTNVYQFLVLAGISSYSIACVATYNFYLFFLHIFFLKAQIGDHIIYHLFIT